MSEVKHNQFFTTHENTRKDGRGDWMWYPIDHFFFATYDWNSTRGLKEDPNLKLIDFHMSGDYAYVNDQKFETKSAAFRYMADLLEKVE